MLESSLTVIVTVISGVIVYVLTELLKEIWLEPLRNHTMNPVQAIERILEAKGMIADEEDHRL